MSSATITFTTDTHRATLTGDRVEISTYQPGHGWTFAGAGRWIDGGWIDNCPAVLGDEVYAELETGLVEAIAAAAAADARQHHVVAEDSLAIDLVDATDAQPASGNYVTIAPKRTSRYPFAGQPVDPSLARLTLDEIEQAMTTAGELVAETARWCAGGKGRGRRSQQFRGGRRRTLIRLLQRTRGLAIAWQQWTEYLSTRTEVSPRLLDVVTMAASGIGESEDARGPRRLFPILLDQIRVCWSYAG